MTDHNCFCGPSQDAINFDIDGDPWRQEVRRGGFLDNLVPSFVARSFWVVVGGNVPSLA